MDLALLHAQQHPADILFSHAGAGVFEAAGNTGIGMRIVNVLHGIQTGSHIGVGIGGLTVRQHIARLDGIASAEFPRINAHHFGQEIDIHLCGKAALRHAEAAECAGNNVVGID